MTTSETVESPPAGCRLEPLVGRRVREVLNKFPEQRQRAVAMFPLRVATMARDLMRLCDMRDHGEMTGNAASAIAWLESKIAEEFENTFGHSMVAE